MERSIGGKNNSQREPHAGQEPSAAKSWVDAEKMKANTLAFYEIYSSKIEPHLPLLLGVARRMLGDPTQAEEIQQQVLKRAWEHATELRDGPPQQEQEKGKKANTKSWLMTATRNLCIDELRRRKQQALSLSEIEDAYREKEEDASPNFSLTALSANADPLPEEIVIEQEQIAEVRRALAALFSTNPVYQEIVDLRTQGATFREVCEELSIPLSTAKTYYNRVVNRLRERFENREEAP